MPRFGLALPGFTVARTVRALMLVVCAGLALPMACLEPAAELTVDVQADRTRISAADPQAIGEQSTVLHAIVAGGVPPYYYSWSVKDPMGTTRNELIDDLHGGEPTFRPGPLIGPYLLTCTVSDNTLKLATDSTIVYVSQDLGLSLSVNRKEVPSGGGMNGQIQVAAETWGGSPPYTFAWSAVGPSGQPDNARLSGEGNTSRLFTSGTELGTYRIVCKLTDATGAMTSQTTEVIVNHLLSLNISSDRPIITPGGGATGKALLSANVSGGKPPYTYSWTILGPDGIAGEWLDNPFIAAPLFTSPIPPGAYRAVCTVADARGQEVVGSMLVQVNQQLSVSVMTNRQRVSSDGGVTGQAQLSAYVVGGAAPYRYEWRVLDPDGKDVTFMIDDPLNAKPTFTSSSAAGTYGFICRITDSVGQMVVDSLEIVVGQPLSADVTVTSSRSAAEGGAVDANAEWVASGGGPNGQATVSAEAIGGSPPYVYLWTIIGPDGEPAPDRLSGSTPNTRFFHSSNEVGTYRVTCTITDATGLSYSDGIKIAVYSHLTLEATMDRVQMPANGGPDGVAHMQALAIGGTPPFTYTWRITTPDGQIDNSRLDDATSATPTFTSGPVSGIYQAKCTVRDSVGQQVDDALLFMVGQPVTLDVTCNRTDVIASGGQAQLRADARGGIPPYRFSWVVTNPSGDPENERLDDTDIANPTFTSALTTGTFGFTCTVTDAAGFVAILSTSLVVGGGLDQGLSVAVTTNKEGLPGPGMQSSLFAAVLGGVPPVTYEWVVLNPAGVNVSTALSDTTTTSPVFTAPATLGTYRVSCTVMDSVLKRFTDSIQVYVGMPLTLDVRSNELSIPATGGQALLTATAHGGVSPYSYVWTAVNPAGGNAAVTLSNSADPAPTFTAPASAGTYQFSCTVSDAAGATAISSVQVYVGMGLCLDVTATRQSLPGGQSSAMNAVAQGGVSPYTYAWSALDPGGADASVSLSDTAVAAPTFTAPAGAGTYRVNCTVTDSVNETTTHSILLYVGMPLTLDVRTDKLSIPATNGQAALMAVANGGVAPYTYAWTATNPSGANAAAALSGTTVAAPTFTAPATAGTYRFTCTVTDAAGTTAVSSVQVYVGMVLSLDLAATRQSLPSAQTSVVTASGYGGIPAYSYAWSVLDPSGGDASSALSETDVAAPTFTAPATAGTYRLTCTVTDAVDETVTETLHVLVGMPLSLDVVAARSGIPATAGTTTVVASPNGGVAPYTYAWTATDPSGGSAAAALSSTTAPNPTFTAPATAGTYRLTCTVTDAAGTTFRDSDSIYVGMNLSLDVTAGKQTLPAGQTTTISAAVQGGISPYTYAWSVLDPTGAGAAGALSATNITAPTFTAPASAGTYRVTCTVTDGANETISRSVHVYCGMPLTVDAWTSRTSIPATGGQAVLTATAHGGVSAYTYAWTATDPGGADAAASLDDAAIAAPTFTAPATVGTYRFTCTTTDAAGTTATTSVQIRVGMGLSLNVSGSKQSLPAGQTSDLNASPQGGVSPYTYAWSALDPSGANAAAALGATNVAAPTFTAPAGAGTYRITCTVTDSANETIARTVLIVVGMPLTVDVSTNKLAIPATGGQADLNAIGNGGVSPYSYAWTALDPSGADASAELSNTAVASPTFAAPATAGTYRFTCTITDAAATTAVASLEVYVGMRLSLDVTAARQSLPDGQTSALAAAAQGGISPYTYAWSVLDPDGVDATAALDDAAIPLPTFTAPATAGTYRITCVVTDAADETVTRTVHVYAGMPLTLDVWTDSLRIPAAGGQAGLTGTAHGGVSPYTYAWVAADPSGADAAASLDDAAIAAPTFTAPAAVGTYRFTCTTTDAVGTTASASVQVAVGMGLSLDVTTVKASLPSAQTAALAASAQGGVAPYAYAWSVLSPTGADAGTALSDAAVAAPTFTAPPTAGTYRLTCTVTDAVNETFSTSIHIQVGMPLALDVRTNKLGIPATGGQAVLTAAPNGGVTAYAYAWTATNPSGGDASATLSSTAVATPTFTAPATAGTYRFTCTVTDSAGATAVASLQVDVGMNLSLDLTAVKQGLPAGQATTLTASGQGGIPAYTYAWSVLDPDGTDASTSLDDTASASPTFTAPAAAGTYRLTCTLTDSANETISRTIHLVVGMPLTLDARTTRLSIPASAGQAVLTAVVNGGVAPYAYAWTATNPSGGNAAAALSGTTVSNPTFTAPAAAGTYGFNCTVTDAAGATALASLQVYVGMGLSVDVTTAKQSLPAAKTAALDASARGGIAPFTYAWSVLDPSGSDASASLDDTASAAPTFTAPATAGTYRFTCTVTDAANEMVSDSVHISVGLALTADVWVDKATIPATGGVAALNCVTNGGVSPYTYAWTATNPSGGNAAVALSGVAVAAPTFTAPATSGTYRLTCTVTDAAGNTAVDTLQVYVGMSLSASVTSNKQSLPSLRTCTLSASAQGGIPAYSYSWSLLDPSGGSAAAALSATNVAAPTFTAPATAGTYRANCTVTDSAGATFTASTLLLVGMPLSLDVVASRAGIPAGGGTATLTATVNGGVSAYTYLWTATNPSGADAAGTLSATNLATVTFTAPATAGTYRFTCVVTDADGNSFRDSTNVTVGMGLSLDISTEKQALPSGQTTVVTATVQGGISAYSYAWAALNPTGGSAASALSATDVAAPTFTAPATAGTYRLTCTVTDVVNETIVRTVHISVGMSLSVDVTAQYTNIPATGGQSSLTAAVTGGVSSYTYAWSALDQGGANASAAISNVAIASPTFTAPAAGTYRVTCTVTDADGASTADSCIIQVGVPLSAYVLTTRATLVAGRTAILSAGASGGTSPYTYAWVVTDPGGATVTGTVLSSATNVAPTFTAPATVGTYRITCTVTDSRSATTTAAMHLTVGMPLSADVTTTKVSIASGRTAVLAANASGGNAPYTYAWVVRDSAGTSVPASLSSAAASSPTFTGPATPGTYRATCTVTDNEGVIIADSTQILVGMPLSLAVVTDKSTLPMLDTATLAAVPNGGVAAYTYSWLVYNPSGVDVTAAVLSSSASQMPTFTAPSMGGTYRLGCTVTDSEGMTFAGAVHVYVTSQSLTLTTPAAADNTSNPTSVLASTPMTSQYAVLPVGVDLPYARNLRVRFTDSNMGIAASFYLAVDGISADGHYQTEYFLFSNPSGGVPGGGTTVEGTKPFARVEFVRWVRNNTSITPSGDERVMIGVGNTFGLPEILPAASSVRQVVLLPGTVLTGGGSDYTVMTTPGAQGVKLENGVQPNGARSYVIYYDDN